MVLSFNILFLRLYLRPAPHVLYAAVFSGICAPLFLYFTYFLLCPERLYIFNFIEIGAKMPFSDIIT